MLPINKLKWKKQKKTILIANLLKLIKFVDELLKAQQKLKNQFKDFAKKRLKNKNILLK